MADCDTSKPQWSVSTMYSCSDHAWQVLFIETFVWWINQRQPVPITQPNTHLSSESPRSRQTRTRNTHTHTHTYKPTNARTRGSNTTTMRIYIDLCVWCVHRSAINRAVEHYSTRTIHKHTLARRIVQRGMQTLSPTNQQTRTRFNQSRQSSIHVKSKQWQHHVETLRTSGHHNTTQHSPNNHVNKHSCPRMWRQSMLCTPPARCSWSSPHCRGWSRWDARWWRHARSSWLGCCSSARSWTRTGDHGLRKTQGEGFNYIELQVSVCRS